MRDLTEPQQPTPLRLQGFNVRLATAAELPQFLSFFPNNPLGTNQLLCLGAFGQPGNVPLGAAIVRPSQPHGVATGHFLLYVRPECRRRKIGSTLMRHLYTLALANKARQLILYQAIHQDLPENAFYRGCGLAVERAFSTFSVEIPRVLSFCEPLVERFLPEDPALAGVQIQPLTSVPPHDIVQFFASHFTGFSDQWLAELRGGTYDLSLCCAAVQENRIIASGLGRSKPGVPSVMLDVILTAPAFRTGPISLAILAHSARVALARKLTHCVFEADERYDRFAVSIARRCDAKPKWQRYRYSITDGEMAARVASA